jgi:hypothetical protein
MCPAWMLPCGTQRILESCDQRLHEPTRGEISETDTKKYKRLTKSTVDFFRMTNKIVRILAQLNQEKKEKAQINNTKDEKGDITTDTTEIQRLIINYVNLYGNKLNKFLDIYNQPKLNHEDTGNLN